MTQSVMDGVDVETQWTEARRHGLLWQLDLERYLDREIYEHGCFETRTTDIVRQWVRPGMKILDVGANFGYFTTVFADLVGATGHVWAFEPTQKYGQRIHWHLNANSLVDRATVLDYGLSDRDEQRTIDIVDCTASLHISQDSVITGNETIRLRRLDDVAAELNLPKVDLVKIDIDGHEPFFIKGGREYLRKHQPAMLMEFAWQNLEAAGTDIWGLKSQLEELGYELYSESTMRRITTDMQFSAEAGDRTHSSANFWAFPAGRGPEYLPTLAAQRVCQTIQQLSMELGRPAHVWLFGGGQHSARAMLGKSSWSEFGSVAGLVDDNPRLSASGKHLGVPVFDRNEAEARLERGTKIDAIVLSTDTHQQKFRELTAGFARRGVKVISLYSESD